MKGELLYEIYRDCEPPCLSVITGFPQVGKSWTGMKMGEILDSSFGLDDIVFMPDHFMDKIKELHDRPDKSQGRILLIDDIGGWNYGRYSGPTLGDLIPLCMHLTQANLICTVRDFYFLEPKVRGLAAHILMVHHMNRAAGPEDLKDKNCVTWYKAKPDPENEGRRIYVRPKVNGKKLDHMFFTRPDRKLTIAYEEEVELLKNALLDKLLAESRERYKVKAT